LLLARYAKKTLSRELFGCLHFQQE
jgi:hypothetical protein